MIEFEKKSQILLKKREKEAEILGMKKGVAKEKSERTRMVNMLSKNAQELEDRNKQIQKLQKQLKEGKTPQTEGFDYEKEVFKLLSDNFPEDLIKATGKEGDNIQKVFYRGKEIGSIIYECKKTDKFDNAFIKEIERHQEESRATYAVLITHAQKEGKSKFFISGSVIVIDPLGVLDLALLLRTAIIEMHQLKISKEEIDKKSQEILKYMQSGDFKTRMMIAIGKSEEAYQQIVFEITSHKKDWQKRFEIYSAIHANVQMVRLQIGAIITGDKELLNETKDLPKLSIGD